MRKKTVCLAVVFMLFIFTGTYAAGEFSEDAFYPAQEDVFQEEGFFPEAGNAFQEENDFPEEDNAFSDEGIILQEENNVPSDNFLTDEEDNTEEPSEDDITVIDPEDIQLSDLEGLILDEEYPEDAYEEDRSEPETAETKKEDETEAVTEGARQEDETQAYSEVNEEIGFDVVVTSLEPDAKEEASIDQNDPFTDVLSDAMDDFAMLSEEEFAVLPEDFEASDSSETEDQTIHITLDANGGVIVTDWEDYEYYGSVLGEDYFEVVDLTEYMSDPVRKGDRLKEDIIDKNFDYDYVDAPKGYDFAGWALDKDGKDRLEDHPVKNGYYDIVLEKDITLYAVYKKAVRVTVHIDKSFWIPDEDDNDPLHKKDTYSEWKTEEVKPGSKYYLDLALTEWEDPYTDEDDSISGDYYVRYYVDQNGVYYNRDDTITITKETWLVTVWDMFARVWVDANGGSFKNYDAESDTYVSVKAGYYAYTDFPGEKWTPGSIEISKKGCDLVGWTCSNGRVYNKDATLTYQDKDITLKAIWAPKGHKHNLKYIEENPGCTVNGRKAHYECSGCEMMFTDAEGEKPVSEKKLQIPGSGSHKRDGGTKENGDTVYRCRYCGQILQTKLKELNITIASAKLVYDGKAKKPKVTVKNANGQVLKVNKAYTLTYKNNTNAGTGSVVIKGIGNYKGSVTKTFRIYQASVAKASAESLGFAVYNGKTHTPRPVLTRDGRRLKRGTDYTLTYRNNVNVGTASVTIIGKGNYTKSKTLYFKVKPASVRKCTISKLGTAVYNGKAHTPKPVLTRDGLTLKRGRDYTLTYKNNVKAGTASVLITGKGNYTGEKTIYFEIRKK